jgi:hypothetical protein
MPTDAQSNLLEVIRECGDHESYDAPRLRRDEFTFKLPPLIKEAFIAPIRKDHVVYDYKSNHHLPKWSQSSMF